MSPRQTLVPCPGCQRHIAVVERRCPFCELPCPADLAARAVPASTQRLGRAAIAVFATALAGAACGGQPAADSSTTTPAAQTSSSGGTAGPVAPAPPAADAGQSAPPYDPGSVHAMYGVPAGY